MPPEATNGVITQYSIQYGGTIINNFGNNTLNTMIGTVEGLSPDTGYILQLRAYTRVGAGPPHSLTIQTGKLLYNRYIIACGEMIMDARCDNSFCAKYLRL